MSERWYSQPELSAGAAEQFAWVHAELAKQIAVLLGVNLVRQLLVGLLSVVMIASMRSICRICSLGISTIFSSLVRNTRRYKLPRLPVHRRYSSAGGRPRP